MKRFLIILVLITNSAFSQVGIGTTSPHPSSILHLNSTNSGLLVPRLTLAQKNAISGPATGLLIFQTDGIFGFWYYNGSVWVPFANSYTFNNGVTLTGSNAQLGGTLVKTTTLDTKDYDLTFETTSASPYPGEVVFEGVTRTIMKTKLNFTFN